MAKLKDKERILKAARKKQQVTTIRLSSDLYKKISGQKGLEWNIQGNESKDLQPRLLYPARLSFKIKGEIKNFPDKKKLKEFVNTKPMLQLMLKGLL